MSTSLLYSLSGLGIFILGLYSLVVHSHLLRKVLAINIMGTGIFMIFIALADRSVPQAPDPVPHAMVLTGIVVAISATALVLSLIVRIYQSTGKTSFEDIIKEEQT